MKFLILISTSILLIQRISAFDFNNEISHMTTQRPSSSKNSRISSTSTATPSDHETPTHAPSFDDFLLTTSRGIWCNSSQFQCRNEKQCVERSSLCNGYPDCEDESDEGGLCDDCRYNNGGCDHECRNTPGGAECKCTAGWKLAHDGLTCEDEDECNNGRGYCQHYCHNHEGGYECTCAQGYVLQMDGSSCKLEQSDAGLLLFSIGHQIRNLPYNSWLNLDRKKYPETGPMVDVRSGIVAGLDTNSVKGHYYYTRNGGIYDHVEAESCVAEGLGDIGSNVAVDWVTGNLYFVNDEPDANVGVCRSDGRFCKILLSHNDDLGSPRGLALFPKFGLMFWTDWGSSPRIERGNMDGTDRKTIVQDKLAWPNGLAIDYVHNWVYFADSELNMIERVRLDGSDRSVVVKQGVFHPFDMIVFNENIFWTDWGLYGVMMADISNSSNRSLSDIEPRSLYHGNDQPYGIGLLHPAYHERNLPNPCATANCSHMCTLTTHAHGHGKVFARCLCPVNYEYRNFSDTECVPIRDPVLKKPVHWCIETFVSACEDGIACENGGTCVMEKNQHGVVDSVTCRCPQNFAGDYCEVRMSGEKEILTPGERVGKNSWVAALLIFLTFVVLVCVVIALICRYGKYKTKIHSLRWSPSVVFRKSIFQGKHRRDFDQRQRIISSTEDGSSKASLFKSDSFSNPVYEEVQVPIHSAYMVFKRENSTMSHDSDADSGLEFNTSHGSP